MQQCKRIIGYRRLGATLSAVLLTCNFVTTAAAEPHYYQYAQPDGTDTSATQAAPYYSYAQPADAGNTVSHAAPTHTANTTKEDQALTYPPLDSLRARHTSQAASLPVQQPVAAAAIITQPVPPPALAVTPQTELAHNTVRNLAALSPAAGSGGQEIQVASAADPSPLPIATMPSIVPLPSSITSPSAPKPPVAVLPPLPTLSVPPLILPAPTAALSNESRQILDKLPPEKKQVSKKSPVTINHAQKNPLDEEGEVKQHEGIGIKISIRRPKADINQLLENAYESLIAGNQEEAIEIYKQVLDAQPANKLALFGLATTYHRAGQIQLARPLYGKLLALDPHNVEGLNNFLVLLSDEDPKEALTELTKLEQTHPGFSPVPAQMAVIYEKMGQYDKAAGAMSRAIALSPENLKYRYDMAIILDKQGAWGDAAAFYQQLITASDRGEKIPTNAEEIQERLTFIRSNKLKGSS